MKSLLAENIKSLEGHCISSIDLEKEYFVPDVFFEDLDPDKEDFEAYTSNAGSTVDKEYNWALLLVWPSINHFTILGIDNGHSIVICMLSQLVQKGSLGWRRLLEIFCMCAVHHTVVKRCLQSHVQYF